MTKGGHGAMLVRNVLSVAHKATIFDCPLVPEEVGNIRTFLSQVHAAYSHMLGGIAHLRQQDPQKWGGPWIFLNANPDLETILSRVQRAGGKITQPKTDIGEYGHIAFFEDTEGNRIGLHSGA